jgi:hypothetical protein
MTDKELREAMQNGDLNVERVLDLVIELNGIVGVGLISLADTIYNYVLASTAGHKKRTQ